MGYTYFMYSQGATDALSKYAVEFKSPKMQAVLQGAIDKAFALKAHPRGGTLFFAGNSRSPKPALRLLADASSAGDDVRRARVSAIQSGEHQVQTTHPDLASSIGRPRENALRAMLTRPVGQGGAFNPFRRKATRNIAGGLHGYSGLLNNVRLLREVQHRPGDRAYMAQYLKNSPEYPQVFKNSPDDIKQMLSKLTAPKNTP